MGNDREVENWLAVYDQVQKFYRLNNENYFKRTQVLMVVIQSALFLSLTRLLGADDIQPVMRWVLSGVICVLGMLASWAWLEMIERQHQRLEFCRYYMRSIESHLEPDVKLQFCTKEKQVFHCKIPVHLGQNGEQFPYEDMRLKPSVMGIEKGVAGFLLIFWECAALWVCAVCLIRKYPGLGYWLYLLAIVPVATSIGILVKRKPHP